MPVFWGEAGWALSTKNQLTGLVTVGTIYIILEAIFINVTIQVSEKMYDI